jgi:hypothetical protein
LTSPDFGTFTLTTDLGAFIYQGRATTKIVRSFGSNGLFDVELRSQVAGTVTIKAYATIESRVIERQVSRNFDSGCKEVSCGCEGDDDDDDAADDDDVVDDDSTVAPDDDTTVAPDDDTTVAPDDDTTVAPDDDTTVAPDDDTTIAPDDDTTVAPDDDTTPVDDDSTVLP